MVEYIVMQRIFIGELDQVLNRYSRTGWHLAQYTPENGILIMVRSRR